MQLLAIQRILGLLLMVFSITMLPPELVSWLYADVARGPFLTAFLIILGVGLASSIRGRNPMIDGFGLIALASLTPMIFVMAYGMLM